MNFPVHREVIGPLAGGVITEHYSFSTCCTSVAILSAILGVFTIATYFFIGSNPPYGTSSRTSDSGYSRSSQDDLNEVKPLLSNCDKQWHSEGEE